MGLRFNALLIAALLTFPMMPVSAESVLCLVDGQAFFSSSLDQCNGAPVRDADGCPGVRDAQVIQPVQGVTVAEPYTASGRFASNEVPNRVELEITDATGAKWSTDASTNGWSKSIQGSLLADGPVTLRAWAHFGGCRKLAGTKEYATQNTPTVTWLSPAQGEGIAGTWRLAGRATDMAPGVREILVTANGTTTAFPVQLAAGTQDWSVLWDASDMPDGKLRVSVQASDGTYRSAPVTKDLYVINRAPPPVYRHPLTESDSDGDGLGDPFGAAFALVEPTADLDHDGLPNLDEYLWDTIPTPGFAVAGGGAVLFPNAPDYDADQWTDGAESTYWSAFTTDVIDLPDIGLVAKAPGATLDTDGDGVPNIHDQDSDNDRLLDGDEVTYGSRPELRDSDCAVGLTDDNCPTPGLSDDPSDTPRSGPGLVALYNFDDGIHDETGGVTTPAGTVVPGRFGTGAALAGTAIKREWGPSEILTGQTTLMAWIKPNSDLNSLVTSPVEFVGWGGSDGGASLTYRLGELRLSLGPSEAFVAKAAVNFPAGEWHHVAGVADGATLRLYIDGDETPTQTTGAPLVASASPLRIGTGFNGVIDEVRVYSRALAGSVAHRAAPSIGQSYIPSPSVAAENTLAAWQFDRDDAWRSWSQLAWDASGLGNDLDMYGVTPVAGPKAAYDTGYAFIKGSRLALPGGLPIPPQSFSVAAWVKPGPARGVITTIASSNTDSSVCGATFGLHLDGANRPMLRWRKAGETTDIKITADVAFTPATSAAPGWGHVAASYDATNGARFFLNGNQVSQKPADNRIPAVGCAMTFTLGRSEFADPNPGIPDLGGGFDSYTDYWEGAMDDVRVYARAHQQSVVAEIYANRFPPGLIAPNRGETQALTTTASEVHTTAYLPYTHEGNLTDPSRPGDDIDDGAEFDYWQTRDDLGTRAWEVDFDEDGLSALSDPDSDGDSCTDGAEIAGNQTDPAEFDCAGGAPPNENIPVLHPINRAYLENRTTDATGRAETSIEVNDTALVEYISSQTGAILNVATEGTPFNQPVRDLASAAFVLAPPGEVLRCVTSNVPPPPLDPEYPPEVPTCVTTIINRTVSEPLSGPASGPLAELESKKEVVSSVVDSVLTTLAVQLRPADDAPDNIPAALASAQAAVTRPVPDVTGTRFETLPDLPMPVFAPDFLRQQTGAVDGLLSGQIYAGVAAVEQATGVPLIEAIDSTHFRVALWQGGTWKVSPNLAVDSLTPHPVDINGDSVGDYTAKVSYIQSELPAPGSTAIGWAPKVDITPPAGNPSQLRMFVYLQYPDSPHVLGVGFDATSTGLPGAAAAEQKAPLSISWLVRGASFYDGQPVGFNLTLDGPTPTPATPAGRLRSLVRIIPIQIADPSKPPTDGRQVGADVLVDKFGGRTMFDVREDASGDAVNLTWNSPEPTRVTTRFIDTLAADSTFGVTLDLTNAPDVFSTNASWGSNPLVGFSAKPPQGVAKVNLSDNRTESARYAYVEADAVKAARTVFQPVSGYANVDVKGIHGPLKAFLSDGTDACQRPSEAQYLSAIQDAGKMCLLGSLTTGNRVDVGNNATGLASHILSTGTPAATGIVLKTSTASVDFRVTQPASSVTVRAFDATTPFGIRTTGSAGTARLAAENGLKQVVLNATTPPVALPSSFTARLSSDGSNLSIAPGAAATAIRGLDAYLTTDGTVPRPDGHHVAAKAGPSGRSWSARLDSINGGITGGVVSAVDSQGGFVLRASGSASGPVSFRHAPSTGFLSLNATSFNGLLAADESGTGTTTHRTKIYATSGNVELVKSAGGRAVRTEVQAGTGTTILSTDFRTGRFVATPSQNGGVRHVVHVGTATSHPTLDDGKFVAMRANGPAEAALEANVLGGKVNIAQNASGVDIVRDNSGSLRVNLAVTEELVDLNATNLPASAWLRLQPESFTYRGTPGTSVSHFNIIARNTTRRFEWDGREFPDSATLSVTSPVGFAFTHPGKSAVTSTDAISTIGATPSPNFRVQLAGAFNATATYDAPTQRLEVRNANAAGPQPVTSLKLQQAAVGSAVPAIPIAAGQYIDVLEGEENGAVTLALGLYGVRHAVLDSTDGVDTSTLTIDAASPTSAIRAQLQPRTGGHVIIDATPGPAAFTVESTAGSDATEVRLRISASERTSFNVSDERTQRLLHGRNGSAQGEVLLTWPAGGNFSVQAGHPASAEIVAARVGTEPLVSVPHGSFVSLVSDGPRSISTRFADTTRLAAGLGWVHSERSTTDETLTIDVRAPTGSILAEVTPLPAVADVQWTPTLNYLAYGPDATLDRFNASVVSAGARIELRATEAPPFSFRRPGDTGAQFSAGGVVRDISLTYASNGSLPADLLSGDRGVVAQARVEDGEGQRVRTTLDLDNVTYAEAILDGSRFSAIARRPTASAAPILFRAGDDARLGELRLSATPATLNVSTELGPRSTVSEALDSIVAEQELYLSDAESFVSVLVHDIAGFNAHFDPALTGHYNSTVGATDLRIEANGAMGYVYLDAGATPPGWIQWASAASTPSGYVSTPGTLERIDMLLAPKSADAAAPPKRWHCASLECLAADYSGARPSVTVVASRFQGASWSSFEGESASVTLQRETASVRSGEARVVGVTDVLVVSSPESCGVLGATMDLDPLVWTTNACPTKSVRTIYEAGEIYLTQEATSAPRVGTFELADTTTTTTTPPTTGVEFSWNAETPVDGLKIQGNAATPILIDLNAGRAPKTFDGYVTCSPTNGVTYDIVPEQDQLLTDVHLIITNDGQRPDEDGVLPQGVAVRCIDGYSVSTQAPVVGVIDVLQAPCLSVVRMYADSTREWRYVGEAAGGNYTSSIQLAEGESIVEVAYEFLEHLKVGYKRLDDPALRVAKWDMDWTRLSSAAPACIEVKGRAVERAVLKGSGLPGILESTTEQTKTTVASPGGFGGVSSLRASIFLSDVYAGGPMFPEEVDFTVDVLVPVTNLVVKLTNLETSGDPQYPGNALHIEDFPNQNRLTIFGKFRNFDHATAQVEESFPTITVDVNSRGQKAPFNFWRQTDTDTLNVVLSPLSAQADIVVFVSPDTTDITFETSNVIDEVRVARRGMIAGCDGGPPEKISKFLVARGIPIGQGARLRLFGMCGSTQIEAINAQAIGSIEASLGWTEREDRYWSFQASNVNLRGEVDASGDSRYAGAPAFAYVLGDVDAIALRGRYGPVGIGVGADHLVSPGTQFRIEDFPLVPGPIDVDVAGWPMAAFVRGYVEFFVVTDWFAVGPCMFEGDGCNGG